MLASDSGAQHPSTAAVATVVAAVAVTSDRAVAVAIAAVCCCCDVKWQQKLYCQQQQLHGAHSSAKSNSC